MTDRAKGARPPPDKEWMIGKTAGEISEVAEDEREEEIRRFLATDTGANNNGYECDCIEWLLAKLDEVRAQLADSLDNHHRAQLAMRAEKAERELNEALAELGKVGATPDEGRG